MTTLHFQTTKETRERLQAYAAENALSVDGAIEGLLSSALIELESQGKYAQLFNKGELRQTLAAYYD
jgi:hypothetical protein